MKRHQVPLLAEDGTGIRVPNVTWRAYKHNAASPFFAKNADGGYTLSALPAVEPIYPDKISTTSVTQVVSGSNGKPNQDVFLASGEYALVGTVGSRTFVLTVDLYPSDSEREEGARVSVAQWLAGTYDPSDMMVAKTGDEYAIAMFNQSPLTDVHYVGFAPDPSGLHVLAGIRTQPIELTETVRGVELPENLITISPTQTTTYTTTVGDTLTGRFFGPALSLKAFTDNRGGLWRFVVDTIHTFDVSVWTSAATSPNTLLIAEGLSAGWHTVKAEFVGADPENAASNGVPRGYLFTTTDGSEDPGGPLLSARYVKRPGIPVFLASNVEFAIRLSSGNFVPSHNNQTDSVVTSLKKVSTLQDGHGGFGDAVNSQFLFDQEYTARDSGSTVDLWAGKLTHKFTPGKVEIMHEITIGAADVPVQYAYFAMLPGYTDHYNEFATPFKRIDDFPADGSYDYDFGGLVRAARSLYSDGSEIICELETPLSSSGFEFDPYTSGNFIRHLAGNTKFYWQAYSNGGVMLAGSVIKTKQTLHIRKQQQLIDHAT